MARQQIPFHDEHLPVTDKLAYGPLYVFEFMTSRGLIMVSSRAIAVPFALGGAGGDGSPAGDEPGGAGSDEPIW